MFAFLTIAAKLRAAQAALAARDFHAVAAMAADLLDTLGMDSLAGHVRGELAALGTGDAREIAENALGVVADVVNAAFSFGKPIVVSAAAPDLAAECGAAADLCAQADAPKATAAGPEAAKATPAELLQWVALLAPVFERLFFALRKRA